MTLSLKGTTSPRLEKIRQQKLDKEQATTMAAMKEDENRLKKKEAMLVELEKKVEQIERTNNKEEQRRLMKEARKFIRTFPAIKNYQPLKIGIFDDVTAQTDISPKHVGWALSEITRTDRYKANMANDTHRYNLQGEPVEALSDEHRDNAAAQIKKSKEEGISTDIQ